MKTRDATTAARLGTIVRMADYCEQTDLRIFAHCFPGSSAGYRGTDCDGGWERKGHVLDMEYKSRIDVWDWAEWRYANTKGEILRKGDPGLSGMVAMYGTTDSPTSYHPLGFKGWRHVWPRPSNIPDWSLVPLKQCSIEDRSSLPQYLWWTAVERNG